MDKFDIDDPEYAADIVRSGKLNNIVNNFEAKYGNCATASIGHKPVRYGRKGKKKKDFVNRGVATVLILSLLIGSGFAAKKTADYASGKITEIASHNTFNENIDEKISRFEAQMSYEGKDGERIEIDHEHDIKNGGPYVSYSYGVLANHILKYAATSEVDTRCVILAAYNVANGTYEDKAEVLDIAFKIIAEKQLEGLPDYVNAGSFKGFISVLGYKDVEDYNNNERKNIKNLHIAEMEEKYMKGEDNNGRKRI